MLENLRLSIYQTLTKRDKGVSKYTSHQGSPRKRKLMMADKAIEVVSKAAEKAQETTLSSAEVMTLALMGVFAVIGGVPILLLLAIV